MVPGAEIEPARPCGRQFKKRRRQTLRLIPVSPGWIASSS